jgi:hypothetical protein
MRSSIALIDRCSKSPHTEFKAGRSTVELDLTRTDPRQVIDTITGLGYSPSVHVGQRNYNGTT